MGARREGRELALQALYQLDVTGEGEALFWTHFEEREEVTRFARELVEGVRQHGERIDALITESTQHWRLPRLSRVDLNLLRLGTFELLARPEIPAASANALLIAR